MIFFYVYMYLERECLVCLEQASVNLPISKVNFFRFLRSYLAVCVGAFVPDLVLNSDICQTVSSDIYVTHGTFIDRMCKTHDGWRGLCNLLFLSKTISYVTVSDQMKYYVVKHLTFLSEKVQTRLFIYIQVLCQHFINIFFNGNMLWI